MNAANFLTTFDGASGLKVSDNSQGTFVFIAYSGTGTDADAGIFEVNFAGATTATKILESGDTVTQLALLKGVGADNLTDADII